MKFKKIIILTFFLCLIISYKSFLNVSFSYGYKYTQPSEVVGFLKKGWPIIILDIQNKNQYEKHHIEQSMPTFAYPVNSGNGERQLWKASNRLKNSNSHIVIVGPFGEDGSERAYEYLNYIGIDKKRLYILQGGMQSWPYSQYTITE